MNSFDIIIIAIVMLNIITFWGYGIDKQKAKKGW